MASRMFDAVGGRQPMQGAQGMPQDAIRAMQDDFGAWMAGQNPNADPGQIMQEGLRAGRYNQEQIRMAQQLAARFGGILGRR